METLQLLAIIFIVAFAVAVYLFVNPPSNQLPSITLATTTTGAAYQPIPANSVLFSNVILGSVSNVSRNEWFGINYTGEAALGPTQNASQAFIIPLNIVYQRYGNTSRLTIMAANALFTNIGIVYINKNGTKFYCTSGQDAYFSSFTAAAASNTYECTHLNTSVQTSLLSNGALQQFGLQNASLINDIPLVRNGVRAYDGQQCYFLAGNIITNGGPTSIFGSAYPTFYSLATCISLAYGVPLNLSIGEGGIVNQHAYNEFAIVLNETSINYTVNGTGIGKLPGPIVNQSSIGLPNIGTYGSNSLNGSIANITAILNALKSQSSISGLNLNSCIAAPDYTCQNVTGMNNMISFRFSQALGYPIYNAELSCLINKFEQQSTFYPVGSGTLQPGILQIVTDLKCGVSLPNTSNYLIGSITLNYTTQSGQPGPENSWQQSTAAAFVIENQSA